MEVSILSTYLGATCAAKILKDWGCTVSNQFPTNKTSVVITDQLTPKTDPSQASLTIILMDVALSNAHCLAQSGVLSTFGQKDEVFIPKYIVETVVSNSLAILCLQHFYNVKHLPVEKGKEHRVSIIDLLTYFGAFFISAKANHMMENPRGKNLLEGGAPFYSVYKCKQGHLTVGNLEPKFYSQMIKGLNLTEEQKEFWKDSQMAMDQWDQMRQMLASQFSQKTAEEWETHFRDYDTCITAVKAPFKYDTIEPRLLPLKPKL